MIDFSIRVIFRRYLAKRENYTGHLTEVLESLTVDGNNGLRCDHFNSFIHDVGYKCIHQSPPHERDNTHTDSLIYKI